MLGVPREVLQRAKEILAQLENEHLDAEGRAKIARRRSSRRNGPLQLTLFAPQDHPLLDEIRTLDLDSTTPLDALRQIQQWQARLGTSASATP